ncbi:hypothetical protein [Wolbachia endosymbiont of Drosophila bicornuta]|uniref:hypothetical protein n=1 Tax=Wolbachia endosymbiont of Drosophila bicornuta TaxID=375918 RepID=UPI00381D3B14
MLLLYHSHKHISYPIRTIARSAILTCIIFMANISIRYKIAQKVRSCRLKRKYTLKDLVDKTSTNCHTLLRCIKQDLI